MLFNLYQPALSVMDYYDIPIRNMTKPEIVEFNQLLRLKYSLLAYIRTHVFRQTNLGTPFVRPLFFDFGHLSVPEAIGT